ncbi:hypothetical protein [Salibaculum griseiflavum]|uniref:Uncharacterized protein n=1 Tax=Salibaculum griseiflavum TaxID=1914409 RepID=A0A2V1P7R2_9RHOB|nr:hypothetical protein [Salibaculum griseiflavum]PWG18541.1 hypothetical protein DFK10_01065 [Salibaculum griseiflavum]
MVEGLLPVLVLLVVLVVIGRAIRRAVNAGQRPATAPVTPSAPPFETMEKPTPRGEVSASNDAAGPWGAPLEPVFEDTPVSDPAIPDIQLPDGDFADRVGDTGMVETKPQTPAEATTGQPFRFKTPDEIIKAAFGRVTEIERRDGPASGSGR